MAVELLTLHPLKVRAVAHQTSRYLHHRNTTSKIFWRSVGERSMMRKIGVGRYPQVPPLPDHSREDHDEVDLVGKYSLLPPGGRPESASLRCTTEVIEQYKSSGLFRLVQV